MAIPRPIVIDFETQGIEPRPHYPPKPVGFSIKRPSDRKSTYYAWGHPQENNCSLAEAKRVLAEVWRGPEPLLFQNAKFDVDVAQTHMGMGPISWERIEDTLYLLFLQDPHASSHSLKPSAERLLGMKPEEQDAVRDWLIANQPAHERITKSNFGKYICLAPGKLVGKYADGDVVRTDKLFRKLYPEIVDRGMLKPYQREKELMPFLLNNERQGLRVDRKLLESDCEQYAEAQLLVDAWLRRQLKVKDLNVDSDDELAEALISAGKADEALFEVTPGGKLSTAKDSLLGAVTDHKIMKALQYRSMLQTRYGTFLEPWRNEARETGGIVHPNWNQVRQPHGSKAKGARTGRLSASRFMNAPVGVGTSQHDSMATVAYRHPDYIKGLPELPEVRKYLLPDKGHLWGKRDYAQQELRILAHFEDGVLLEAFKKDPKLDMHTLATQLVERDFGIQVGRTRMKTIGFSLLYGMGLGELASRLEMDTAGAKQLKSAYLSIFPGLKDLQDELTRMGKSGEPLRTWGGREYYCEPPKYSEKHQRMQTFEYKLLNYLIQGSAADCTKQALINYSKVIKDGRFLLTVHDEINFSCPAKAMKSEMKILKEAMADVDIEVAMLSDGKTGKNWAHLKKFEEK